MMPTWVSKVDCCNLGGSWGEHQAYISIMVPWDDRYGARQTQPQAHPVIDGYFMYRYEVAPVDYDPEGHFARVGLTYRKWTPPPDDKATPAYWSGRRAL